MTRHPVICLCSLLLVAGFGCRSGKVETPPHRLAEANRAATVARHRAQQDQWIEAVSRWRDAAEGYGRLNRRADEAVARHNLGIALAAMGEAARAREQLNDASAINESLNATTEWWRNQVALLQLDAKTDPSDALEQRLHQLVPHAGKINDGDTRAAFENELGLWHLRQGDLEAATGILRQAVKRFQGAGNRHGEATATANLALGLEKQRQFAEAAAHWNRALALFEAEADPHGIATALAGQGRVLVAENRELPLAEDHLRRAARTFAELRESAALDHTLHALAEARKAQGKPEDRDILEQE